MGRVASRQCRISDPRFASVKLAYTRPPTVAVEHGRGAATIELALTRPSVQQHGYDRDREHQAAGADEERELMAGDG